MLDPDRAKDVSFQLESGTSETVTRSMWVVGMMDERDVHSLLDELVKASDVERLFPKDSPYKHVNMYDDLGSGRYWEISLSKDIVMELSGQDGGKFAQLSKLVDTHAQTYRSYNDVRNGVDSFFKDAIGNEAFGYERISVDQDYDNPNLIYLTHNARTDSVQANQKLYQTLNSILGENIRFEENGKALLSSRGMSDATSKLETLQDWIGKDQRGDSYQACLSNIRGAFDTHRKESGPTVLEQAKERVLNAFDGVRKAPGNLLLSAAHGVDGYRGRRVDDFNVNSMDASLKMAGEFGVSAAVLGAATQTASKLGLLSGDLVSRVQNISLANMVPIVTDPVTIACAGLAAAASLAIHGGNNGLQEARSLQEAAAVEQKPARGRRFSPMQPS